MSETADRDEAMTHAANDLYMDIPVTYRRPWKFGPFSGSVVRRTVFRVHQRSLGELIAIEKGINGVRERHPGAMEYVLVAMLLVGPEARFQTLETLQTIIDCHYAVNYPKAIAEAKAKTENPSPSAPSSDDSAPIPSTAPGTPHSN